MGNVPIGPDNITHLRTLTTVVSWLSVTFVVPVVVVNCAVRKRRKFPSRLTTYFSVSAFLFNLTVALGALADYNQIPELLPTGESAPASDWCRVQGFFFQLFGACVVAWYVIIYYTLAKVTSDGKTFAEIREWERYFLALGWGLPLLSAIIPAATSHLGHEAGLWWCWIDDGNSAYKFACMYGPLALGMVASLVWLVRIIRALLYLRSLPADGSVPSGVAGAAAAVLPAGTNVNATTQLLLVNDYLRRHSLFVFTIFVVFSQVFAWGCTYMVWQIRMRAATSQADMPQPLDYRFAVSEVVCVCGIGLVTFGSFGLTRQNYELLCRRWIGADSTQTASIGLLANADTASTMPGYNHHHNGPHGLGGPFDSVYATVGAPAEMPVDDATEVDPTRSLRDKALRAEQDAEDAAAAAAASAQGHSLYRRNMYSAQSGAYAPPSPERGAVNYHPNEVAVSSADATATAAGAAGAAGAPATTTLTAPSGKRPINANRLPAQEPLQRGGNAVAQAVAAAAAAPPLMIGVGSATSSEGMQSPANATGAGAMRPGSGLAGSGSDGTPRSGAPLSGSGSGSGTRAAAARRHNTQIASPGLGNTPTTPLQAGRQQRLYPNVAAGAGTGAVVGTGAGVSVGSSGSGADHNIVDVHASADDT